MNVLVIYGTIEGQTKKISKFVKEEAFKLGHKAILVDADDPTAVNFEGIDAVILAASVHQRRHPQRFEALIEGYNQELAQRRTLLLSVSLNAAFPEGIDEAGEYVVEFKMRTGLVPDDEVLVAGAVRTEDYDYFAMQVVQHVVLRGREYDPHDGTHEFTDWQALSSAVVNFLGKTS